MPKPLRSVLPVLALVVVASGCVKKSTHQVALADLDQVRTERRALQDTMEARTARARSELAEERAAHRAETERLEEALAEARQELTRTERRRAEAASRFEEARTEVHRLEVLLSERGSEFRQLERRLQSLAAIEREVRQRNAIYEEVLGRFQSLIDAGRLTVSIDRGRLVIQLPQDILFESGSATLGAEGRRTLTEVARALAQVEGRSFQVEGHTDSIPIATGRFPSNWELSSARALSVVRLLVEEGVPPDRLSGAGYGEFQPVAPNSTPDDRRRNRRIEIVMLPNLDVIAASQVPSG